MLLQPGVRVGPYEIQGLLGAGGMGEVYRARDGRLGRDVAIKILQDIGPDSETWARFEREARAASALTHPNVCAVYDLGESEGRPFLVLELLEGVTLRQFIDGRPVATATAIDFGVQIADALEAAHARGIVHRDIKPANVMVTGGRHIKVLDFGLARQTTVTDSQYTVARETLTAAGFVAGTPQYLAPEVLRGARADARSDVWALGIVLFEMFAGHPPFSGPTTFEMSSAIVHEPVPVFSSSVPFELRSIVERCLAKNPDERYQHASEVRAALEASRAGATPVATTSRLPARPLPFRWARLLWAAGFGVAIVAGVYFWTVRLDVQEPILSTGGPASSNQQANDAFELAMQFQGVQNDIPRATQALERALELDPRFAEALRIHASNSAILILNGYSNDTSSLYRAEQELRKVAEIAPDLPGLPAAFVTVYLTQGRRELIPWQALDEALAADPSQYNTRFWLGIASWLSGDAAAAKREFQTILKSRPLFGPARMYLGETLREERDVPGAIREIERVLEQGPNNISAIAWLTLAYLDNGDLEKARTLLKDREALFAKNYLWREISATLLAVEGDRDNALKAMDEETLKFAAAAFPWTLGVAEFYAVLGDKTQAIEWLERTVRNGDERTAWFRANPRLASLRQDPRFTQMIESVESRRKGRQ